MSVYVDPLRPCQRTESWPYDRACHLTADSPEELRAFVKRLGMNLGWVQRGGRWSEHFDLNRTKRAEAVRLGAIEESSRDAVKRMRAQHEARRASPVGCPDCGHLSRAGLGPCPHCGSQEPPEEVDL